jgi:hypothetical protein
MFPAAQVISVLLDEFLTTMSQVRAARAALRARRIHRPA